MTNINLNAYGVSELSIDEQKYANGGSEIVYIIFHTIGRFGRAMADILKQPLDDSPHWG